MATIEFEISDYLDEATTQELLDELRHRGVGIGDYSNPQLLADLIASGNTQDALDLLHRMAPDTHTPRTTLLINGITAH